MAADQLLTAILLGGLLGTTGQGIRVIAGLKKLNNEAVRTNTTMSTLFETHTLVTSLLIGFVSGVLCVVGLWDKIANGVDSQMAMAILGAGYAGADFIEAFMRKNLPEPTATPAPTTSNQTQPPAVG